MEIHTVLRRVDFSVETQKNSTATRWPPAAAILKEGTTYWKYSSGMAYYSTAKLLKKWRKCSQEWCCGKATRKHYRHELLLFVSCLQKDTWFCTVIFRLCWITGRVLYIFFFTDFSMFRARQEKCCCSWILSRRHTSLRLISQANVPSNLQGLGCYFTWRSTFTNRSLVLLLLPNPFQGQMHRADPWPLVSCAK